jgi:hypothetical protein
MSLTISIGGVRREESTVLENALMCDLRIGVGQRINEFESVRVDDFLSQLVACFLSVTVLRKDCELHADGHDAYVRFYGGSQVEVAFFYQQQSATHLSIGHTEFQSVVSQVVAALHEGIQRLNLPRKDWAHIRQSFLYGWLITPDRFFFAQD